MSDKESADEKTVSNEEMEVEDKSKGQKRKRAVKKATPAKKKLKAEEIVKPPVDESNEDKSESEDDEEIPLGLLDRSPEVTGTRIRKQVERLNVNSPSNVESADRRKNELLPGKGVKLGTSPKILAQLQSVKQSDMVLLHRLLFKRPGTAHEIKKNIREFSGYPFTKEDKDFENRKHLLEKNTLNDLKFICQILCLEKSGTKEAIIERILEFCLSPNPSSKPVKKKTKKPKENKKKGNSKTDDDKSSRSSPNKKNAVSSPTVDESSGSSSEDEEEDENESSEKEDSPAPTPAKKSNKKVATPKTKEAKSKATPITPKANKEATTPKANKEVAKSKKKTPKKSPKKTEIKVKLPPVNKAKKKLAPIESNESEDEEEKKTADTSNNKSTDDEKSLESSPTNKSKVSSNNESTDLTPNSAKKSTKNSTEPTNDELASTIKQILKDANLEDMTMKNLCRQVYDKFPEFDLEKTRKEFIRSTAREILGGGQ